MSDIAKTFSMALDRWYKFVLAIGLFLGAAALTLEVKVLGNSQALRLSAALICLGLCAWKGDKTANEIIPPTLYNGMIHVSYPVWRWD
jgi:hypothetical protein